MCIVAAQEFVVMWTAGMPEKGSMICAIPGIAYCAFSAASVSFGCGMAEFLAPNRALAVAASTNAM